MNRMDIEFRLALKESENRRHHGERAENVVMTKFKVIHKNIFVQALIRQRPG